MFIRSAIIFTFFLSCLSACYSPGRETSQRGRTASDSSWARGFRIENHPGFRILHVVDPWQGSSGIHLKYVLSDDISGLPDSLEGIPRIKTPVSKVICMSTTHVAMIKALGRTETIVGISGPDYITDSNLRHKIDTGEIPDVGADQSLNYERIISIHPDVIFSYAITAAVSGMVKRLDEPGIPVILDGDYLENEPLGKTEWIRFIAAFYNMDQQADSIFDIIEKKYLDYRLIAKSADFRPSVMMGLPWNDAWYVPGGSSFAAAFIRDAGGDYIWAEKERKEASPVDLEAVYLRGASSDFWINSGDARSLEDIQQTEPRLINFKAYREGMVYNNTARLNSTGGNDFWESGVMEPHLILADLILIFHPELMPGYELRYYEKLH